MSGETLQVYFLGTAGALPTPVRNPPCIMIRRGTDTILFDCGEGAQQQMMRARCGFTGRCHLRDSLARGSLPWDLRPCPDHVVQRPHRTAYHLRPCMGARVCRDHKKIGRFNLEVPPRFGRVSRFNMAAFERYTVNWALRQATRHAGTGTAPRRGSAPVLLATANGPSSLACHPGPFFGRLQRGETIKVTKDGQERECIPSDVMGAPRPGRKIVYTGDTRPVIPGADPTGKEAAFLIHDATYDESESRSVPPSSIMRPPRRPVRQPQPRCPYLALTDISARDTDTVYAAEAKAAFSGTVIIPDDLFMLDVNERNLKRPGAFCFRKQVKAILFRSDLWTGNNLDIVMRVVTLYSPLR